MKPGTTARAAASNTMQDPGLVARNVKPSMNHSNQLNLMNRLIKDYQHSYFFVFDNTVYEEYLTIRGSRIRTIAAARYPDTEKLTDIDVLNIETQLYERSKSRRTRILELVIAGFPNYSLQRRFLWLWISVDRPKSIDLVDAFLDKHSSLQVVTKVKKLRSDV